MKISIKARVMPLQWHIFQQHPHRAMFPLPNQQSRAKVGLRGHEKVGIKKPWVSGGKPQHGLAAPNMSWNHHTCPSTSSSPSDASHNLHTQSWYFQPKGLWQFITNWSEFKVKWQHGLPGQINPITVVWFFLGETARFLNWQHNKKKIEEKEESIK